MMKASWFSPTLLIIPPQSQVPESLRARWPDRELIACFEPRSNTAVTNVFEDRFADASHWPILLCSVRFTGRKIPAEKRINPVKMMKRIQDQGKIGMPLRPIKNWKIIRFTFPVGLWSSFPMDLLTV